MFTALSPVRSSDLVARRLRSAALLAGVTLLLAAAAPATAAGGTQAQLERVASEHYDAGFLKRGRAYREFDYALFFLETVVILGGVWVVALGYGGTLGRKALAVTGGRPWASRWLLASAVYLGISVLRLPFSVARYGHARNYGLRYDSWTAFFGDWLKGVGVGWVLVVLVGFLLLTWFAAWPRRWWWISALGVSVLAVGAAVLAPLVVDPMFHRFERLPNRALEEQLLAVAGQAGVGADRVLVVDASRRTGAVNAYFTGLGKTRRIVLYDTLVRKFPPSQVKLVVAHELGHWKHHHLAKGLVLGLLAATLGLAVAQRILGVWAAKGWGGITGAGDPGLAVAMAALFLGMMTVALVPSNWVSRRMETQADRTALELTKDPETFVRAEVRLGRENLADVVPPPWIEFVLYTHPANARRILMAERWK